VMVDDGEMLVLGGLISEGRVDTADRVPLLGDIPAVGRLFRYDAQSTEKRNLMIFLYPRIVRTNAAAAELTSEKYSFIRRQQLLEAERIGHRGSMLLLPEWRELMILPPPFTETQAGHRRLEMLTQLPPSFVDDTPAVVHSPFR
jgi:general secretion pathway protein D